MPKVMFLQWEIIVFHSYFLWVIRNCYLFWSDTHFQFSQKRHCLEKKEWHLFTPWNRKYPNVSRPNRVVGSRYWKAISIDKPITAKGSNRHVGINNALVLYVWKEPKGNKTNWIMHEYNLVDSIHVYSYVSIDIVGVSWFKTPVRLDAIIT